MKLPELLTSMRLLGPEPSREALLAVAAAYRQVRLDFLQEKGVKRCKDGTTMPDLSRGQKLWMETVWRSQDWKVFLAAWKVHGEGDVFDWEFRSAREYMLTRMAAVTRETSLAELRKVVGLYRHYRSDFANAVAIFGGRPGQALAHMKALYQTPQWTHYQAVKARAWQARPEAREAKRAYAKSHYQTVGKAQRSTPEARAKLAAQRRARYSAKKTKTSEGSSP